LTRALYIDPGETPIFAVHHPAEGEQVGSRPPVLFCPPWGWDDVASYRVRRTWAARLAAAGFPTLRFDLPATGNSGGAIDDDAVAADWAAAVGGAATWLADTEGTEAVAALGIGLGGLLALMAIDAGAPIAALALWGAAGRGKRFARETKAFSRMQPWYGKDATAAGFDPGVPDGWLEAGGFLLGPGTLGELKALAPALGPGSALRRALVFDRDGVAADPDLTAALEAAGAEVEQAAGPGWGEFVSHPEEVVFPQAVAAELERWLASGPPSAAAADGPASVPAASESIEVGTAAGKVRETAIAFAERWGETVGVLAEPTAGGGDLCAVFLNAGAVRAVGPNRMWVEAARRWAARGVPSLRLDLEGIGEADGGEAGSLRVGDFYEPRYPAQVGAVLDELERRGVAGRFLLVGLCAGGYWAFRTAVDDPRVVGCLQVNAGALRWVPDLPDRREAHRSSRAFESRWWRKLLGGEIEAARIRRLLRALVTNGLAAARRAVLRLLGRGQETLARGIESDLDRLRERGTRVLLAFSGEEALGEELEREQFRDRLGRWPNVEWKTLPGTDHTLRPPAAQRAVAELLDSEIERLAPAASPSRG
jgi:pimeloyl-ACP methyl ester carboxylesterase